MSVSPVRDFIDPRVISRLAALPLLARFPMLGNVSGKHRSPVRGSSLEFAAYRKYVPGDDIRRLDWRAYARSDRFFIKEFEADTNLRMCLVIDTSGSMAYRSTGLSKLEYAQRLAGTLAYLAARQGDAVGLFLAATALTKEIPPKRNAVHLRGILDEIGQIRASGTTGLIQALHDAADRIPQRALIVVISDLFVPTVELSRCFQHLRFRKHDVAVFHLLEQAEIDFPFDRPVRFVDLEGGSHVLADPAVIASQYRLALQTYLQDLTHLVRDAHIDYQRISIETKYEEALARFLLARLPKKAK